MYTSFKDFSLNVYDDTNLLQLVLDSQRLSFSQELTPTRTLGLSLGLGLAWGHFQDKYFYVSTKHKDLFLNVYDDTNLLHLVSDSQCLSFSHVLTPTPTLGLSLGLGLGLGLGFWGILSVRVWEWHTKEYARVMEEETTFNPNPSFQDFSLNVYDDTNLLHLV